MSARLRSPPHIPVPADAIEVTGPLKSYSTTSDSGFEIKRGFCSECGSPVINRPLRFAARAMVAMGSLDDPEAFVPRRSYHAESAPSWDPVRG